MSIREAIVAIERQLWKNDPVLYRENFTEDALISFPETGVIDIDFAVDAIREENAAGRRWAEVAFEDVRTLRITEDVVVLLYKAVARWAHEKQPTVGLATTVYVRRDGRWKAAHHHQSPVQAE